MKKSVDVPVVVVGAGIAGLTAAWRLKQLGIDALVLEAEPVVGGRMQSVQVEDALIDSGAQFLSSAYSVIPDLIKAVGLSDQFIPTSEWVGFVKNNQVALLHPRKPWRLITNGIVSIFDFIRLIINQYKLFKSKKINLNDITSWIEYDNQLANTWMTHHFGDAVARELTSTLLNGFYFQSLQASSASLACAVLAFSTYKPHTMTLSDGMKCLPQKMAALLNVKTHISVSSILENSSGVKIISDRDEFTAEYVICAVPAPVAKNIIQHPDNEMCALFETSYSSSIVISFLINNSWKIPPQIAKGYGFLFNPQSDTKLAAFTIENNKCISRKKEGYLINVMLSDESAKQLLQSTDDLIVSVIQSDVEAVLPDIFKHQQAIQIFRWPYAMPCTPMGRADAVQKYRDTRDQNNRIWLAGDYLGFPWTDSAAWTGLWAANRIAKLINSNREKIHAKNEM